MITRIVILTVLVVGITVGNNLAAQETEGSAPPNSLIHKAPKHAPAQPAEPNSTVKKDSPTRDDTALEVRLRGIEDSQTALSNKPTDTTTTIAGQIAAAKESVEARISLLTGLCGIIITLLVAIFGGALIVWKKLVQLETRLEHLSENDKKKNLNTRRMDFE
jgi:hypothetical protein